MEGGLRMKNKYLVSITEASKIFGIGRDKLYAIVRSEPDIPVIKVGDITKINVPLFEEWINKATLERRVL